MDEIKHPGLNHQSIGALKGAAKWAKFIAITGFIGTALMAFTSLLKVFGNMAGPSMRAMIGRPGGGGSLLVLLDLIFIAVLFCISLYLYRFAAEAEKAVAENAEDSLSDSLCNLHKYFRLQGIMIIFFLALFLFFFLLFLFADIPG